MKNYIKIIIEFCTILILFTVFIYSNNLYDGISTAKIFYFYFVISILLVFTSFYLLIKNKQINISFNLIDVMVLIFFVYNFFRLITTEYFSFSDNYFICLTFLTILYFVLKFLIQYDINSGSKKYFQILIALYCFIGSLQALYGILQLYNLNPGILGNQFKIIGTLGNPDYFTGYLMTILPFVFGIYIFGRNHNYFKNYIINIALITFLLCIFIIPSTNSRTSWISLLIGMTFMLWNKYEITKKINTILNSSIKKLISVFIVVLLIGLIAFFLYQYKPNSVLGRFLIWKVTSKIIFDAPFFGTGFNRFEVIYNNYQSKYFAEGNGNTIEKLLADNVRNAHNEYLQIWSELGIIGLLIFVGIFIFTLKKSKNNFYLKEIDKDIKIIILSVKSSVLSLLIFAFFSFPFHILPTLINLIFLLSIISASNNINKFEIKLNQTAINIFSISLLTFITLFIINNVHLYKTYSLWKDCSIAAQFGDYISAEKSYSVLYPNLKYNGEFLFNYGANFAALEKYNIAIKYLDEAKNKFSDPNLYILLGTSYDNLGQFIKAEKYYLQASFMIPNRLYPKYLLANLYYKNKYFDKASLVANEIISANIKIETIAAEQIKKEMKELIKKIQQEIPK